MRTGQFVLRLLLWLYLGYLMYFLATGFEPEMSGYRPPLAIVVLDSINLFIHEAGHFFLKPFGRSIEVLGGSLFQCFIPLLVVLVGWRQNRAVIPFGLFWLGENLVNVSAYIRDAPYKHLRLLAQGLIHDWNWLLSDNLEVAEPLGASVYYLGLLLCLLSLLVGVWSAVQSLRESTDPGTV